MGAGGRVGSGGAWRAAAPIGHHGALATWLLLVLPFGVLTARERGSWRAVGVLAAVAAAAAVLATRSLVAAALLVVQAGMLWQRRRGDGGRSRAWRRWSRRPTLPA